MKLESKKLCSFETGPKCRQQIGQKAFFRETIGCSEGFPGAVQAALTRAEQGLQMPNKENILEGTADAFSNHDLQISLSRQPNTENPLRLLSISRGLLISELDFEVGIKRLSSKIKYTLAISWLIFR